MFSNKRALIGEQPSKSSDYGFPFAILGLLPPQSKATLSYLCIKGMNPQASSSSNWFGKIKFLNFIFNSI